MDEIEENNFDAEGMIKALSGGADNTQGNEFTMPEEIAGLKSDEWMSGLSVISGGEIENLDTFRSKLSKANSYDKLEKEHAELQEKIKLSANEKRFANDYVKELNALYENGASKEEIALFRKIQPLNLDEMSDVDTLKLQMSMQYPGLSKSQVEAAFEKEHGDADEWSEGDKAILAKSAIDARAELKKIQFDSKTPESLKSQQNQEAVQRRTFDYWEKVEETVGVQDTFKISEQLSGDKDKLFEFEYKLPEGAIESLKNARMYHLMSGAVKVGDVKSYKKEMAAFTDKFIYANYGKDMMRIALEEQGSRIRLETNQRHHNSKPTHSGKDHKDVKINSALEAELDKHREKF